MRCTGMVLVGLLAATPGCILGGAPGNDLGLAGVYFGDVQLDSTGTVTFGSGAGAQNVTMKTSSTDATQLELERAFEGDAILTGMGCDVVLVVDGKSLVLQDEVTCVDETENTFTANGQTTRQTSTSSITVEEIEITSGGAGKIELTGTIRTETREEENDEVTQTADLTSEVTFEGERVAAE